MSATKSTAAQTQIKKAKNGKMARLLTSTTLAAAGLMAMGAPANADNWTSHTIIEGSTTVDTSVASTTNIFQTTDFVKAQGSGNIDHGWTVNVAQPSSGSKYVLYDYQGDATKLMGALNANGEIYIFNAQGIVFGGDSKVDVGALITSTGYITDDNIKAGKFLFEGADTGGSIVLNGSVTVAEAGLAAFVAPQVTNNGVINAKLGKVAMASGNKVTLDLYGDSLIEIAVDDKAANGLIKNTGVINAEGGVVAMSVQTAKAAVDDVINMGGVVNASSATVVGGKIVLSGGKSGVVKVAGKADASGTNGGSVKVTGENVLIASGSELNADGGKGADGTGNGGDVVIIGENAAVFRGSVFARGGVNGGNGGFVDTSGYNHLSLGGSVDTSAIEGYLYGTWLIDPRDINIVGGTNDGNDSGFGNNVMDDGTVDFSEYTSGDSLLTVYESEIEGQSALSNIILRAERNITASYGTSTDGVVTLANNRSLTMQTRNDSGNAGGINLAALGFTTQGTGNITVTASDGGSSTGNIVVGALNASGTGNIALGTDNGSVTLLGAVNAAGGNVTVGASDDIIVGGTGSVGGTGVVGGAGAPGGDATAGSSAYWDSANTSDTFSSNPGAVRFQNNPGSSNDYYYYENFPSRRYSSNPGTASYVAAVPGSDGANGANGVAGATGATGANGGNGSITTNAGSITLVAGDAIILGGSGGNGGQGGQGGNGGDGGNSAGSYNGGDGGDGGRGGNGGTGGTGGAGTLTSATGSIDLTTNNLVIGGGSGGSAGSGSQGGSGDDGNDYSGSGDEGDGGARGAGGSGGAGGAAGNGSIATAGTVAIGRYTSGDISLGDNNGGLHLSNTTLSKIAAGQLVIGRQGAFSADDDIFADDANLLHINNVVLNTRDTSGDELVEFKGNNTFNALTVNADNGIVLDNDARVSTTRASSFNAGGNFVMEDDSTLDTNGNAVSVNAANVDLNEDARIVSEGGHITITTGDITLDDDADIDAFGGNILINNSGTFRSDDSNSLNTRNSGTITLNQDDDGSIQNAIDAINNTGNGLNTINVGAGTYNENVRVYEDNFVLRGARAGTSGNDASRSLNGSGESKIFDASGSDGNAYGFKVTSGNVRIDGFSINVDGAGVLLDGGAGGKSGFLVENNIIRTVNENDSQDVGIQGKNVSSATVEDNNLVTIGNDGMVFTGGGNVTIRNNTVNATDGGAYDGIRLAGVSVASVTGNTVHNTGDDGIVVENGTGTTTLSGNTVYNIDKGINVSNTAGLSVSGNTVYNVDENGVHVVNSASAQITNNLVGTLGFVTGTGIFVDPSPLTNIAGNTVNGGQIGIHVLDSNGVTVGGFGAGQANTVTGSYIGIKIQNSDTATVAKNTVNNSGWDAIQIVDGSDNAQVLQNDINGINAGGASGIAVMHGSHGAVLDGNTIDNTQRLGIYVLNSNGLNIKNNLINNVGLEGSGWYLSGIHLEGSNSTTVDNNEVKNARGDGIHVGGTGNLAAQSTTGVVIKNNSVFLTGGDAVDVTDSAGVQITGNALGTDRVGPTSYLVIGANNVGGKGVNLNSSANANIANNVVFQTAGNGIAVAGSNGTTISSNYVDAVGANAIHVLDSANARILNNNVGTFAWYFGADSIRGDGIYAENANGTWIKGNTVTETYSTAFDVGSGIHVKNSNNVVVGGAGSDRNNISNIDWDGVKISGGDNVTVDNNRIQNVTRVGIYGGSTTNATIKNNVLVNANTGLGGYGAISTDFGSGLKITGNDIDGSVGHGIRVYAAGGTNLIDGNFVDGVNQDGINAEGVNKLTVSNNKVGQTSNVGGTGINVFNGTHSTTISKNKVDRVGWTGIAADTVAALKITDNTVGQNSASVGQGIYVNNSANADVIGNNVYNALQYGLNANFSNGLDIYDNDFSGLGSSTGTGVFVQNSSNVNVGDHDQYFLWWKLADRDNRIGSFQQGVYVSGGTQNDVVNNTISNVHYGVTLYGTTYADVIDNDLTGNSVTGVTVSAGSHHANVSENDISNFATGVSVDGSNHVKIDDNDIDNVDNGIYAINTYGLKVTDNDIDGGKWGEGTGIRVANSTSVMVGGFFDGNDVSGFYDGIHLENAEDAYVKLNKVHDMDHDGIQVFGGNYVFILANFVTDVGNDGIYAGDMSGWNYPEGEESWFENMEPNVTISGNVVDWTGGDGIQVNNVTYSKISANLLGLDGYASEGSYPYGASIGGNGILVGTTYNDDPTVIERNLVANTGANGIYVNGVEDVYVTDNTIWNTYGSGIVVENTYGALIDGNYVGAARPFGPYFSIGGGFIGGDGIRVSNYGRYNYGSVWVTSNNVENAGDDGIDVYGTYYARILGNNVNLTGDDGIVAANIGNSEGMPSITNLEESLDEEDLYYNLIISDNVVTDAGQKYAGDEEDGDGEEEGDGFEYEMIRQKERDLGGDGIDVFNASSALIQYNTVENAYDDGIVVEGLENERSGETGGSGDFMPKMLDYYGYEPALVVIRDNDVTDSGADGIEVRNMALSWVDTNRVLNSGVNGFLASGFSNREVVLTGNTFTDNPVGARFESGLIDLAGATNTFNGGEIGMQFDPATQFTITGWENMPFTWEMPGAPIYGPEGEFIGYGPGTTMTYYMPMPVFGETSADLNLAGDTIGTTVFNGQSRYYVELLNGALFNPGTPTILDGLNATYDGFSPASVGGILTQAQYNAIEAKIYHYNDLNSLGLFFFGAVPNDINDKDIYRAFAGFRPGNGPLNLTITGLPMVPGFSGNIGNFLNSITPAAGGSGNTPPKPKRFANLIQQLAGLEPAAGGEGNQGGQPQGQQVVGGQQQQQNTQEFGESTCWGDAMAAASGGTIVSMNYSSDPGSALAGAASCQTGL